MNCSPPDPGTNKSQLIVSYIIGNSIYKKEETKHHRIILEENKHLEKLSLFNFQIIEWIFSDSIFKGLTLLIKCFVVAF